MGRGAGEQADRQAGGQAVMVQEYTLVDTAIWRRVGEEPGRYTAGC